MKLLLSALAWERFQAALADARTSVIVEGGLTVWGDSDETFAVENSRYPRMPHDIRIVALEGHTEEWMFDVVPE